MASIMIRRLIGGLLCIVFSLTGFATQLLANPPKASSEAQQSFEQALSEVTAHFINILRNQQDQSMVISVKNHQNNDHDKDAKWIETELYFAFEQKLSNVELLLLSEAIAGISSQAIHVNTTYEIQDNHVILRIRALKDQMSGAVLTQQEILFNLPDKHRKTLVAVMDMESEVLNESQRKAYSNLFRSSLARHPQFHQISAIEMAKVDVNAIKQKTNCREEACNGYIGEKLGVNRMVTVQFLKVDEGVFFITAKLSNIQDGALLVSQTVEFNGDTKTIQTVLDLLADKLLGEETSSLFVAEKTLGNGKVFIKSSPSGADIILDGEELHLKTDTLIPSVSEGRHVLTLQKDGRAISQSFEVKADEITRLNMTLERRSHDQGRGGPGGGRGGPGGGGRDRGRDRGR
ncbi:MAG: PEGA domain-containing protein [SAR324 cluster bacterium]|nr:PEGA domain-containing protein [SAR324 cluster bacterium]